MPKVRWVLLYGFYSKFHTLSISIKVLKIDKVGTFFETQYFSALVYFFVFVSRLFFVLVISINF